MCYHVSFNNLRVPKQSLNLIIIDDNVVTGVTAADDLTTEDAGRKDDWL